jgi:hypothetical protein
MIDRALGLDPEDMSEAAKAKRQLRGLADLDGISFVAKVAVEPRNDPSLPDHNRLDRPVLPTDKEWRAVMDGEDVPPRPRSRGQQLAATARRWLQRRRGPACSRSRRQRRRVLRSGSGRPHPRHRNRRSRRQRRHRDRQAPPV